MPHWDWRWCAEIESFPNVVMAARHPHSKNLGDVNAKDFCERAGRAGRPDVLVFGSPCQDFSVAGKRLGLDGARGNMALVALGIIDRLKPRWFTFENVPGLFSNWSGGPDVSVDALERCGGQIEGDENSDFAAFLGTVDELGYSGAWAVLDAQWRGVAQRRERVFFVGHIGDDWRPSAAVLFEPASLRGDYPPSREAGQRVAPTVEARAGAGGAGWGNDFMSGGGLATTAEVAGAVSSKWRKGTGGPAGDECYNLIAQPILEAGARTGVSTTDPRAGIGIGAPGDPMFTLQRGKQRAVAFQTRIARNGRGQPSDVAPALNGVDAGATSDMRPMVASGDMVRRLTPLECERLQGFKDGYTAINYRGKPAADGPRYQVLGNAMAVPAIKLVLDRIEMVDRLVAR